MTYAVYLIFHSADKPSSNGHVFPSKKMAENYGNSRLDRWPDLKDFLIEEVDKEETHIFADGKLYPMHDSVEMWKKILEDARNEHR